MSKHIDKVKQLEREHRLITENLIDAIWTADVETLTFEYITPSISRISGYTPEEYVNRKLEERIKPESFEKIKALLAQEIPRFQNGLITPASAELEMFHKSGDTYWVEVRARLFQEPGDKLKIIGVTRDITVRKGQEQEKNRLIEELGKALAEKKVLIEENKLLKKLLPVCSGCRRIRDENGKWLPLDLYVQREALSQFSHTICNDCKDAYYGEKGWYRKKKNQS